ncbi:MAG: hypothetical protein SOW29_01190, partial [Candidatus Faecousia sp.]|nr:hypothetical protein [Candidatus Faecousia sp.]
DFGSAEAGLFRGSLGQHRTMGTAGFGGSFPQARSTKNGKYIQYSRIFHAFTCAKISRRISLPHYAVLPYSIFLSFSSTD